MGGWFVQMAIPQLSRFSHGLVRRIHFSRFAFALALAFTLPLLAQGQVVINEIHYDPDMKTEARKIVREKKERERRNIKPE